MGLPTSAESDAALRRDLKTLATFIGIYCKHRHPDASKALAQLKGVDVQALAGRELFLCPDCSKLLMHAFTKRMHCPMNPKPACKHCPSHCYHPTYRAQIRQVMAFSGKKLVLSGRLDYLYHLLF